MRKNVDKNISINLNGKYSQKLLDHAETSATDASDLIGNKIAYKITKVSNNWQQNNSGTVTNDNDKEMSKERYITPQER